MSSELNQTKKQNQELFGIAYSDLSQQIEAQRCDNDDIIALIKAAKKSFGVVVNETEACLVWTAFDGDRSLTNKGRYGEAIADMGHYGTKKWLKPIS